MTATKIADRETVSTFQPLALRIDDACRALSIGRTSLYALIAEGKLKPVKLAGRTLIPLVQLERLVNGEAA